MKLNTYYTLGLATLVVKALGGVELEESIYDMDEFDVLGSKESVFEIPGSGFYLSQDEIVTFQYTNIDQILRQVPGVYSREEDGYGLFPNISMRGVDTSRSGKVTMMEDGVLTAPAPYAAPSAYYSPTVGRMSALEVLKGSSQIRYGPHTTGGVINYISTPIPLEKMRFVKLVYGEDNDLRRHTWRGGRKEFEGGVFGYLVEVYSRQTEGFKYIDSTATYEGSDHTGFEKTDTMVKLSWQPDSVQYHYLELKLGYTDFTADETYLGISTQDFASYPYGRYAGSRFDEIDTHQARFYLRHQTRWPDGSQLSTTLYYNNFHRNWYKLNKVDGKDLATALFNGTDLYEVLTGTRAGELRVKANNRSYYLGGFQSELTRDFDGGDVHHELVVGARLHADRIRRFQWEDIYEMNDRGGLDEFILYGKSEPGGSAGNRRQRVEATSVYVSDRISSGNWAVTPGVRYEGSDWEYFRADGRDPDVDDAGSFDVLAPGVSVEYRADVETHLFAALHRGISLLSPGSARAGLETEEADSLEIGVKHDNRDWNWYGEAVLFRTDFKNLVARESDAGGNPVGGDKNIGEITTQGLELLLSSTLHRDEDRGIQIPLTFAFTYTDATFDQGTASGNADSTIFAGAQPGNKLPYVPEIQWNVTTGIEGENWAVFVAATQVEESYADGSNLGLEVDTNGNPDARFGLIDGYFLVDFNFNYQVNQSLNLFANIQNIFEEKWVASRIPHGPRPGAPRHASVGLVWQY